MQLCNDCRRLLPEGRGFGTAQHLGSYVEAVFTANTVYLVKLCIYSGWPEEGLLDMGRQDARPLLDVTNFPREPGSMAAQGDKYTVPATNANTSACSPVVSVLTTRTCMLKQTSEQTKALTVEGHLVTGPGRCVGAGPIRVGSGVLHRKVRFQSMSGWVMREHGLWWREKYRARRRPGGSSKHI